MKIPTLSLLVFIFWSFSAQSYYDEFVVGSSADRFTLKKNIDGNYYVKNKMVELGAFNDFVYLFGTEIAGACPKLKSKPDITIIAKKSKTNAMDENKVTESKRDFYLDTKIVKGDRGCAPITGDGIYYLPMHRYWFTGEPTLSLPTPKNIKIEKDGEILADLTQDGKSYKESIDTSGMNWDFFNNFKDSLKSFNVFARLHPAIAKGKPSFEMTLNGAKYKAYYVARNLWAMKFPKSDWLVASQNWSLWEDMSLKIWRDRHFALTRAFANKKSDPAGRLAAMQDLGVRWSPSIKHALQRIIKDPTEPHDLRSLALRYLKQRPSLDNFGAMIHALKVTKDDREFQIQLTNTLKIKNPKAQRITEESTDEEVQQAIQQWLAWWKKLDQ